MALTHLVDTSVLTRLDRAVVRRAIEPRVARRELARATMSDLEVGFSARDQPGWDALSDSLCAFDVVETSADHVRRALQVQRMLAADHQRGRKIPDLLIAAAAEARGLTVLHYDADFDRIAAVTGQSCQWVAPAGSVN